MVRTRVVLLTKQSIISLAVGSLYLLYVSFPLDARFFLALILHLKRQAFLWPVLPLVGEALPSQHLVLVAAIIAYLCLYGSIGQDET